eukprot:scaffold226376_cov20-Prasinocladus_malaysianus.AAC.1
MHIYTIRWAVICSCSSSSTYETVPFWQRDDVAPRRSKTTTIRVGRSGLAYSRAIDLVRASAAHNRHNDAGRMAYRLIE